MGLAIRKAKAVNKHKATAVPSAGIQWPFSCQRASRAAVCGWGENAASIIVARTGAEDVAGGISFVYEAGFFDGDQTCTAAKAVRWELRPEKQRRPRCSPHRPSAVLMTYPPRAYQLAYDVTRITDEFCQRQLSCTRGHTACRTSQVLGINQHLQQQRSRFGGRPPSQDPQCDARPGS